MASLLERCPGDGWQIDGRRTVIVDKPWGKVATYALNQPLGAGHHRRARRRRRASTTIGCGTRCGWCSTRGSRQIGNRVVEAPAGEEFMVSGRGDPSHPNAATTRGRVLEIAYGYTTEDDTQRLEDAYGRPLEPDW